MICRPVPGTTFVATLTSLSRKKAPTTLTCSRRRLCGSYGGTPQKTTMLEEKERLLSSFTWRTRPCTRETQTRRFRFEIHATRKY